MAVTAKGSTFVPCPAGLHHAVCVDVHDLGVMQVTFAGATKQQFDKMVALGLGHLDKSGVAELTFKGRHA